VRRVDLTISFIDDNGTPRVENHSVETSYTPDDAGEHRLSFILATELKVMIGDQAAPKHNATALKWLEFPGRPEGIEQYFDIRNSQALWFELSHLVMGAEGDLALSQVYKSLEPAREPSFGDDIAINDLYYVHDRKMMLLNQAVQGLTKVQDIVNRLLHESLGGNLIDTSKPKWEKAGLMRDNVEKELRAKRALGTISQTDFDAISQALAIPVNTSTGDIVQAYRNRLIHHIRPSVDYAMFYSALDSRAGEEMRDAHGKVIGRKHTLLAQAPVQYTFHKLHAAYSEYLDAVVAMLEKLSQIEILRR
jgi:hypothetical protein